MYGNQSNKKQLYLQTLFLGQTFCIRVMFRGFMVEASNVFSFEGEMSSEVKYSVEWWIFKPKKSGEQV